jgi:hypothetical protein
MKGKNSNWEKSGNNLIEYPVSILVAGGNSSAFSQLREGGLYQRSFYNKLRR